MATLGKLMESACKPLADDEIHVWSAQLEDPKCEVGRFYEALTTENETAPLTSIFERHRRRLRAAAFCATILAPLPSSW